MASKKKSQPTANQSDEDGDDDFNDIVETVLGEVQQQIKKWLDQFKKDQTKRTENALGEMRQRVTALEQAPGGGGGSGIAGATALSDAKNVQFQRQITERINILEQKSNSAQDPFRLPQIEAKLVSIEQAMKDGDDSNRRKIHELLIQVKEGRTLSGVQSNTNKQ